MEYRYIKQDHGKNNNAYDYHAIFLYYQVHTSLIPCKNPINKFEKRQ